MARTKRPIGTAATTRLRKVECDHGCGYSARVSRKVMLLGVPTCPCGGRILPSTIEDASLLAEHGVITAAELAEHPEAIELAKLTSSVMRRRITELVVAGADGVTGRARLAVPDACKSLEVGGRSGGGGPDLWHTSAGIEERKTGERASWPKLMGALRHLRELQPEIARARDLAAGYHALDYYGHVYRDLPWSEGWTPHQFVTRIALDIIELGGDPQLVTPHTDYQREAVHAAVTGEHDQAPADDTPPLTLGADAELHPRDLTIERPAALDQARDLDAQLGLF